MVAVVRLAHDGLSTRRHPEVLLVNQGQDLEHPAARLSVLFEPACCGHAVCVPRNAAGPRREGPYCPAVCALIGEIAVGRDVRGAGQGHLLEIILAARPPGRLSGGLHGRQEQPHQDADDGDYHQQFDERESA